MAIYHDLTTIAWRHDVGQFTAAGGWSLDEDQQWRRTLYLMPRGGFGGDPERVWWMVEEPAMHALVMDLQDMGRAEFAYEKARAALARMGLVDSLTARHQVITIINDHIDQLILMRSRPPQDWEVGAEIIATDINTGTTRESVIYDKTSGRGD